MFRSRQARASSTQLTATIDELESTHPGAPPRAMVLNDAPEPVDPHVFLRGNPGRPGKAVPRQFLSCSRAAAQAVPEGSGRLELARAIAGPNNPLTARVMVNRIWLNHFGAGLVDTPSDFGAAERPADPSRAARLPGHEFMEAAGRSRSCTG